MKTYIQIGANIGNDHFFRMCNGLTEISKIILIEPLPFLMEDLKTCYSELNKRHEIHFLNIGIVTQDNLQNNKMTIISDKNSESELKITSPLASFVNRKSIDGDAQKMTIEVKTKTFNSLCEELQLIEIEELHVDTEGYDYEILLSINTDTIKIKKIYFEIWAFNEDDINGLINTGSNLLPKIENKYIDYTKEIVSMDRMPTYYYYKN